MFRRRLLAFAVLAMVLALPGLSQAQTPFYIVDYFDNANVPGFNDATVRVTNVGLIPSTGVAGVGDQCALIYVWAHDQQLAECCGCRITPNGLIKLSVNNNLTGNALTGGTVTKGTFVIVESAPNAAALPAPPGSSAGCNPGVAAIQTFATFPISAWATHVQDSGEQTEGNFIAGSNNTALNADASAAAIAAMAAKCQVANILGGSGHGLCNCLGDGDDPPAADPPPVDPPPLTIGLPLLPR